MIEVDPETLSCATTLTSSEKTSQAVPPEQDAADGGHVRYDDIPIDNDDEANDHSLTVLSASGENSLEGKWSDPDIDDAGGGIVALLRCQRCAGQVAMLCRTPGAF